MMNLSREIGRSWISVGAVFGHAELIVLECQPIMVEDLIMGPLVRRLGPCGLWPH